MQVMENPMRKGELLNPILTNKEGLVGDMKVGRALSTVNNAPGFQNPVRREQDND